jgi:hypothetical protein
MAEKVFKVRFYAVNVLSAESANRIDGPSLFATLHRRAQNGLCPPSSDDGLDFEIRDLVSNNRGAVYYGVFATIRDDAPHIREAKGGERAIPLALDEGILEKNHFIYYSDHSVLAYQINQRASHPTRFENYLRAMAGLGHAVTLDDMLNKDALQKLRHGIVKAFDVSFAAPRNPAAYDPTDFGRESLRMMERCGANSVRVTLKATHSDRGLLGWAKKTAMELVRDPQVRKLQVKLDGEDSPIDLFADVISEKISVEMDGRYPNSRRTFEELAAAKGRVQAAIDEHFG